MNGRDVFVPRDRPKHECDPPQIRPLGSIWRCDCGRYFYVFNEVHDGCAPPAYYAAWAPVRWWNRWQRRIIADRPHVGPPPRL